MWIIFKVSVEFVIIFHLLYILIMCPRSTWDLTSPRPGIKPAPPALEGKALTTGGSSIRVTFLKTHKNTLFFYIYTFFLGPTAWHVGS